MLSHSALPGSCSWLSSMPPRSTGSNPASRINWAATGLASSSPDRNMTQGGLRWLSSAMMLAESELKARTQRACRSAVIPAIGSAAACSSVTPPGMRASGSVVTPGATAVYSAYAPCVRAMPKIRSPTRRLSSPSGTRSTGVNGERERGGEPLGDCGDVLVRTGVGAA